MHEAQHLEADLRRARIEPFAWVVNQSFALSGTTDPLLATRGLNELQYIDEVGSENAERMVIAPWLANETLGVDHLRHLFHAKG